ncbi:MAG: AraC family transcriptional regulator [Lachnospiraceae bacterium]|nr:AraC family transcriptional regulator [Lachnospiraceae bacterium]
MYTNSAYLHHSRFPFMDKNKPLIVASCGTYHLYTRPKLPTLRPRGRIDYQLLYIASGKAHFYFKQDEEEIVPAGHMVLYRPKEMQKYVYYGNDQAEVYWVHFTGKDAKQLLEQYGFASGHVFDSGSSPDYQRLFRQMIQELQLGRPGYEDLLPLLLKQLLILVSRQLADEGKRNGYAQKTVEQAAIYFNECYQTDINIEAYAASKGMSACWFIRNFRQYHNMTPMKYILSLRVSNARHLLETTSYNVNEIAAIVGYENPLYFSRLFKKMTGFSPTEYRNSRASLYR